MKAAAHGPAARPRPARLHVLPRTRNAICLLGLLLALSSLHALEVYIAPIAFVDESGGSRERPPQVERSLYALLSLRAFGGRVVVKPLGDRRTAPPRSFLEALRLADSGGYPYLIYGYLRRTDDALILELKLADRDARAIQAVFFAGDSVDRYDRLLSDMDVKMADFFRESLGAGPGRRADEPECGRAWTIPVSVGYWTPAGEPWSASLLGLVDVGIGLRFWPSVPAYIRHSRKRQLGAGTDLEYSLGAGAPGKEGAVLHSLLWRLSADWRIEPEERKIIGASFGPFLRMDALSQSRKYAGKSLEFTASPGAGGAAYFAYRISRRFFIGFSLGLDVTFYKNPLATVCPGLCTEYRFLPKGGEGP